MDFAAHLGCPLPAMQVPRCQSQMTIVNQFFCSPRRKWFSDVPAELRGGDISVDRSRSELISRIPKSKKRYPRRQCPRAMHARHDPRLANGMRPIRRPSVTRSTTSCQCSIEEVVRAAIRPYLQKKHDLHLGIFAWRCDYSHIYIDPETHAETLHSTVKYRLSLLYIINIRSRIFVKNICIQTLASGSV